MAELIDKERAYQIFLEHQVNEGRLLSERISIFFLANSILFISLVMLIPSSQIFSSVVTLVGLTTCIVAYGSVKSSIRALKFWLKTQEAIEREEEGIFAYFREKQISPQIFGRPIWEKGLGRLWRQFHHLAWVFMALWIAALGHIWNLY